MPLSGNIISPELIGRTREMEILERALQATQNGGGRCVLLTGEAGIGKSRLAAELGGHATAAHFLILQGYCSDQDNSFSYAPWIDALRAYLAAQSPAEANELLGAFASELVKLLPELELLLPSIHPTPQLDPAAEKHRLFESLARFAASLAAAHPLLIILEDLQWSDEQSLELMHFFVRRIAAVPILILGTYRNEDTAPLLAHHLVEMNRERRVEEIQLSPLSRPEVGRMAQAILRTERPFKPDWLDFLMLLTEGNPFFVEEMTKSLVETGAWGNARTNLQIPRSIQEMVKRRVERLPETAQRILSFAAVIGERFDFGLLQEVVGQEEPDLLQMLKEMITARLIVEESADQFAFRHALMREAVYAMLMKRERKAMHQTIGGALEHSAGTRTEAAAPQLAYHFYQAGIWEKAIQYSQRAGERAQALYAQREALSHFTQALEAARQLGLPPPHVSLRGRAQAYEALGEFDLANTDYEAALDLSLREADRAGEWQARIDLGLIWQSRDLDRAGDYYREALKLAHYLQDSSFLGQSLNRIGNWYMNRGQVREALKTHLEALELFRKSDHRRGTAQTLDLLGIVSYQLGEVIQGAAYLKQAVPILRELEDRQGQVNTLANLSFRAVLDTEVLGNIDYLQLADSSNEALQIAQGINWYHGEALALIQGALSLKHAGEYGRALGWQAQVQSVIEESQDRESSARTHLNYGVIFVDLLALSEGQQHLETALALAQELGSGLLMLSATARLASAALLQNDKVRAQTLLTGLLPSEYPTGQETFPQRRYWCSRAELELTEGNPRRSLEIIDRLLAYTPNLAEYGPHAVPYLSLLRGQALAELGQEEKARIELEGAISVARAQGQPPMLWRLHAVLGNVYRAMGRRENARREFSSARNIIKDLANRVPEGALRVNFLRQALAAIPTAPALTPRQAAKKVSGGLTAREREIAGLIARGKSNREIADELVISEKTAERHVANILTKLEFNSRTQIAAWVIAKGKDK